MLRSGKSFLTTGILILFWQFTWRCLGNIEKIWLFGQAVVVTNLNHRSACLERMAFSHIFFLLLLVQKPVFEKNEWGKVNWQNNILIPIVNWSDQTLSKSNDCMSFSSKAWLNPDPILTKFKIWFWMFWHLNKAWITAGNQ